ncbi:MAG: hypothetical protein HOP06_09565 [Methylotenera sp.]|nr:hypothetical protein [Methylotenera sp.]
MSEITHNKENHPDTTTPFFAVSIPKLIVMSVCTFSLYDLYWFYKNWLSIKTRFSSDISPFWRAFFAFFYCYQCFSQINSFGQEENISGNFPASLLAIGWIVTMLMTHLPEPYFLVSTLAFIFVIPVQIYANKINNKIAPAHYKNSNFSKWNWGAIVIGGAINLLVILTLFIPNT